MCLRTALFPVYDFRHFLEVVGTSSPFSPGWQFRFASLPVVYVTHRSGLCQSPLGTHPASDRKHGEPESGQDWGNMVESPDQSL